MEEIKNCYDMESTVAANDELSEILADGSPQIIYKHISHRNKDWIKICLVQMDYNLSEISPPAEFEWELSNVAEVEDKVTKALKIAYSEKVDIICFPELSFSKKMADKISKEYKDIILIGGSYYHDGYNVCPVFIDGYVLDPPYKKCYPSIFESSHATGRGMKPGNIIYILQTSCGLFSVLTCIDYQEFSERICKCLKERKGKYPDFIINPCYDPNISRFQEKASSDCGIFALDVIQVNKAPDGKKFGKSCIIGREHDGIKSILINEKFRPKIDVIHKLCELSKESMLIVDIDIEVEGPLASIKPDYQGRIKVTRDKIYEFNGVEWVAVTNHTDATRVETKEVTENSISQKQSSQDDIPISHKDISPFHPFGSIPLNHASYVTRDSDKQLEMLLHSHKFIYVQGEFCSGKSSLLIRVPCILSEDWNVFRPRLDLYNNGNKNTVERSFFAELHSKNDIIKDWISLSKFLDGAKLVFLIDEIGSCSNNMAAMLIKKLYSLAESAPFDNIRIVLTFMDPIDDYMNSIDLRNPKYHNCWGFLRLTPFKENELIKLLNLFPLPVALLLKENITLIQKCTSMEPNEVQKFCDGLWKYLESNAIPIQDLEYQIQCYLSSYK